MQGTSVAQSANPRPDIPSPFQWHGAGLDGTARSGPMAASMLKARGFRSTGSLVEFFASHGEGNEDSGGPHCKVHVLCSLENFAITSKQMHAPTPPPSLMLQQGAHQPRYGIGITHHWTCPLFSLHLEQDQIAADGVVPSTGFHLRLSSLDTSVALEGQNKDIRQVHLSLTFPC